VQNGAKDENAPKLGWACAEDDGTQKPLPRLGGFHARVWHGAEHESAGIAKRRQALTQGGWFLHLPYGL